MSQIALSYRDSHYRTTHETHKSGFAVDSLDKLSDSQKELHEYLMNFRNRHIAHSVNSYELNQLIARFEEGRELTDGVYEVDCQHSRVVSLGNGEMDDVISLTTALLEHVELELKTEKAAFLDEVREIPIDTLLKNELEHMAHGRNTDIGMRK